MQGDSLVLGAGVVAGLTITLSELLGDFPSFNNLNYGRLFGRIVGTAVATAALAVVATFAPGIAQGFAALFALAVLYGYGPNLIRVASAIGGF